MKKTTAILTALLVMAVLFASCSNGMGEKAEGSAAGTSSQKVMVSLGVDVEGEYIQKDVSVDDFDLSGLTVWYKATHKWSQNRNVSGDTAGMGDANDFVQIPNFTSGELVNLGSFTAGIWDFFVEVRKGSDPVYTGRVENYQLYTGHAAIEITVAPITGTGTVAISVQVPTTGANEKLYMTYTGLGSSIALKRGSVTSNITTFFYDIDDDGTYEPTGDDQLSLAGGAYTFTFLYYD
ncbi:MAG: hypothetical protein IKT97_03815, partial [Spirochaetia bacterium]|nr:hypothetical protein [Spirochaetia bacterium]